MAFPQTYRAAYALAMERGDEAIISATKLHWGTHAPDLHVDFLLHIRLMQHPTRQYVYQQAMNTAVMFNHFMLVDALVTEGGLDINGCVATGVTYLGDAIANRADMAVQTLLRLNADVNLRTACHGCVEKTAPLNLAVKCGADKAIMQALLQSLWASADE